MFYNTKIQLIGIQTCVSYDCHMLQVCIFYLPTYHLVSFGSFTVLLCPTLPLIFSSRLFTFIVFKSSSTHTNNHNHGLHFFLDEKTLGFKILLRINVSSLLSTWSSQCSLWTFTNLISYAFINWSLYVLYFLF